MNFPTIFKNFDQQFDDMFYNTFNYDVENLEDKYVVYMDVPGVLKEDVSIKLLNGLLTVVAERKGKRASTFRNTFKMPNNASNEVDATLDNGVLTVTIPKSETAKAKLIPVK